MIGQSPRFPPSPTNQQAEEEHIYEEIIPLIDQSMIGRSPAPSMISNDSGIAMDRNGPRCMPLSLLIGENSSDRNSIPYIPAALSLPGTTCDLDETIYEPSSTNDLNSLIINPNSTNRRSRRTKFTHRCLPLNCACGINSPIINPKNIGRKRNSVSPGVVTFCKSAEFIPHPPPLHSKPSLPPPNFSWSFRRSKSFEMSNIIDPTFSPCKFRESCQKLFPPTSNRRSFRQKAKKLTLLSVDESNSTNRNNYVPNRNPPGSLQEGPTHEYVAWRLDARQASRSNRKGDYFQFPVQSTDVERGSQCGFQSFPPQLQRSCSASTNPSLNYSTLTHSARQHEYRGQKDFGTKMLESYNMTNRMPENNFVNNSCIDNLKKSEFGSTLCDRYEHLNSYYSNAPPTNTQNGAEIGANCTNLSKIININDAAVNTGEVQQLQLSFDSGGSAENSPEMKSYNLPGQRRPFSLLDSSKFDNFQPAESDFNNSGDFSDIQLNSKVQNFQQNQNDIKQTLESVGNECKRATKDDNNQIIDNFNYTNNCSERLISKNDFANENYDQCTSYNYTNPNFTGHFDENITPMLARLQQLSMVISNDCCDTQYDFEYEIYSIFELNSNSSHFDDKSQTFQTVVDSDDKKSSKLRDGNPPEFSRIISPHGNDSGFGSSDSGTAEKSPDSDGDGSSRVVVAETSLDKDIKNPQILTHIAPQESSNDHSVKKFDKKFPTTLNIDSLRESSEKSIFIIPSPSSPSYHNDSEKRENCEKKSKENGRKNQKDQKLGENVDGSSYQPQSSQLRILLNYSPDPTVPRVSSTLKMAKPINSQIPQKVEHDFQKAAVDEPQNEIEPLDAPTERFIQTGSLRLKTAKNRPSIKTAFSSKNPSNAEKQLRSCLKVSDSQYYEYRTMSVDFHDDANRSGKPRTISAGGRDSLFDNQAGGMGKSVTFNHEQDVTSVPLCQLEQEKSKQKDPDISFITTNLHSSPVTARITPYNPSNPIAQDNPPSMTLNAAFVKDFQYSKDSSQGVLSPDCVIIQPSSKKQPYITSPPTSMNQSHLPTHSIAQLSINPHSSSPPAPSLGSSNSSSSQHSSQYDSDGSSPLANSESDEIPAVHHLPFQQKRAIVHAVQPMLKCQNQIFNPSAHPSPYPVPVSAPYNRNNSNSNIPTISPFNTCYSNGTPLSANSDEPSSSGDDQDSGLAPCSPLYRSDELMVLSNSTSSEDVPKLFDLDTGRRDDWESILNSSDRSDEPEPTLSTLDEQLQLLSVERNKVKADIALNEKLGAKILYMLEQCEANELEKKKLNRHLVETGKILALRYKLHRRMNRVKWALNHVNTEEVKRRDRLEAEKINLQCQIDDADTLKEIMEKRSPEVDRLLNTVLRLGQRLEYKHFFEEMQKLLAEIHEIDQRISVFQEKKLLAFNQSLSARTLKTSAS